MFPSKSRWLPALGLSGALALGLFGCGGSSLSKPLGTNPNDTNSERAFHALVGVAGGKIDVIQRSVALNSQPLAFGQGSSYVTVASGISVKTDAVQAGTQTQVAPEDSDTMNKSYFYTEVASGVVGASGTMAPRLFQLTDNFPTLTGSINAAVRLVNLSPNAPPVSLYNTTGAPPTAVAITGLVGVTYGNTSNFQNSAYIQLTGGTYNLTVRDNAGNTLATLSPQTLSATHSYTIFVTGLVAPAAGQPAIG